jgi:hypothetical protein
MKLKSVLNKAKKLGLHVECNGEEQGHGEKKKIHYSISGGKYILSWTKWEDDEDWGNWILRPIGAVDDPHTDLFFGFWPRTLKQLFIYLMMDKEEGEIK